jgi:hypothetical protein
MKERLTNEAELRMCGALPLFARVCTALCWSITYFGLSLQVCIFQKAFQKLTYCDVLKGSSLKWNRESAAQQRLFRKTHFICLENIHGCEPRLVRPHLNNETAEAMGHQYRWKLSAKKIQPLKLSTVNNRKTLSKRQFETPQPFAPFLDA